MDKVSISGHLLEKLLLDLGWSPAELSRIVGVSRKTVGRWVNGKCPKVVVLYLRLILLNRRAGNPDG